MWSDGAILPYTVIVELVHCFCVHWPLVNMFLKEECGMSS